MTSDFGAPFWFSIAHASSHLCGLSHRTEQRTSATLAIKKWGADGSKSLTWCRIHVSDGPISVNAGESTVGNNIKFGLCVLALLCGVIYIEAGAMNLSTMDTVRQLGADLLHRLFY
ncbi:hypothetical protein KB879_35975 (plasmid) [Cupriavidus sp. KK10]|jgi:hypothetical protein|uniref:hypothetical protein n=1 Tax=Cupriavidus sp. KK10 TaxID=1478019 RepID=UPI001BAA4B38|nr:hypothetical protein [Cupriavidus sp. KK10]QUN31751.1 hypothetical protein KB879_35975 [Cupriavidus sp. KK10]